MNTIKVSTALLLGLLPVLAFGAIYKTVDENGNVIFTDTKPDNQISEEVKLKPVTPLPPVTFKYRIPVSQPEETQSSDDLYTELAIIEPADGATVRNSGNFSVTVQTLPQLMPGHHLRLLLDGRAVDKPKRTFTFTLINVDRGSHQLQLQVMDRNNRVVQSISNTVYVQRTIVRPAK